MKYFEYIFSDKKAFRFWITLFTGLLFYIGIFLMMYFGGEQVVEELYNLIYPLFLFAFSFLSFFIFYTTGYLNFQK